MPTVSLRKLFARPDGSFETIAFLKEAMKPGETELQFVEREMSRIKKETPAYNSMPEFTKTKDEIRNVILSHPKGHKRRLRIRPNGEMWIDATIKLNEEILDEKKASIRSKMKLGQLLNDSEIDFLLEKK